METAVSELMGDHYIVELAGCDPERIGSLMQVRPILTRAVEECGATPIQYVFHQFAPVGVTATVLLAESHLCLHTWPERGYAAADIFTCGETMEAEVAVRIMEGGFRARDVAVKKLERGIPG